MSEADVLQMEALEEIAAFALAHNGLNQGAPTAPSSSDAPQADVDEGVGELLTEMRREFQRGFQETLNEPFDEEESFKEALRSLGDAIDGATPGAYVESAVASTNPSTKPNSSQLLLHSERKVAEVPVAQMEIALPEHPPNSHVLHTQQVQATRHQIMLKHVAFRFSNFNSAPENYMYSVRVGKAAVCSLKTLLAPKTSIISNMDLQRIGMVQEHRMGVQEQAGLFFDIVSLHPSKGKRGIEGHLRSEHLGIVCHEYQKKMSSCEVLVSSTPVNLRCSNDPAQFIREIVHAPCVLSPSNLSWEQLVEIKVWEVDKELVTIFPESIYESNNLSPESYGMTPGHRVVMQKVVKRQKLVF